MGPTYLADATNFNARDHQRTDHNLDLTALARYTPNSGQTYEFGYAQKTRSPNLYERFAWSTGGMAMRMVNWAGDGNGYLGNLDLKPEALRAGVSPLSSRSLMSLLKAATFSGSMLADGSTCDAAWS